MNILGSWRGRKSPKWCSYILKDSFGLFSFMFSVARPMDLEIAQNPGSDNGGCTQRNTPTFLKTSECPSVETIVAISKRQPLMHSSHRCGECSGEIGPVER
jgi:hypothetical protein